jgi:hypothetical protein
MNEALSKKGSSIFFQSPNLFQDKFLKNSSGGIYRVLAYTRLPPPTPVPLRILAVE